MISPPGVLIPAEWAAEVGQHLGRSLRIDGTTSPKLLELCDELVAAGEAATTAASTNGSRNLMSLPAPPQTAGMTVTAYARTVGLSERRIRQMCQTGQLPAHKTGRQWSIETEREEDTI